METPRTAFRIPKTELTRLAEIAERFPNRTAALLFAINHTWATTTADGSSDYVWKTHDPRKERPDDA